MACAERIKKGEIHLAEDLGYHSIMACDCFESGFFRLRTQGTHSFVDELMRLKARFATGEDTSHRCCGCC